MAKFPDPTKNYQAQPIDKVIDATKLDTQKFSPPQKKVQSVPPLSTLPAKVTTPKTTSPPTSTPPPPSTTPPPGSPPTPPSKPTIPPSPSPFRNIIPLILGLLVLGALIFVVVRFVIPRFTNKEPDPVTLTYWGLWEPQSVMQVAISDYERAFPHVKINYSMQSPKNYRTRLVSAIQQGEGPDIARIHNTWMPMLKEFLSPAPEEVVTTADLTNFYPVFQEDFVISGRPYALPMMIDGLALYYNQDLLDQIGAQPPSDWNELRKLAFDLTVRNAETGNIERAGVAIGTTGNVEHWSDILGLLLLQNSADPANPEASEVKDALSFYTVFSTQDKVWDAAQPNSIYAFATGTVAMIIAPSWRAVEIKAINPDFNFKTVPAPTLAGSNDAWATYWAESVPVSSQNQEEAWKFVKFLTATETLQKLYSSASQIRTYGEPYSRKDMASILISDPVMGAFVEQGPNYKSWYLADRTFDEGINDQIAKYYEDAINSINQGRTVTAVIDTLSEGVAQVLAKYPLAK